MFLQPEVASVLNCDVHIDRGYMSAVVCSTVPGLRVLDSATGVWIPVSLSVFFHPLCYIAPIRLTNGQVELMLEAHSHVIVFPCFELQELLGKGSSSVLHACVHRVDKADKPRLSFNYELREPVVIS